MNKIIVSFLLVCVVTSLPAQSFNNYSTNEQGTVETLEDSNFSEKISSGITIVDFYASWCGPCKQLMPIYIAASQNNQSACIFYKVNIDESPVLTDAVGIEYVPTLIIYKDGAEIARRIGGCTQTQLKAFLDLYLD